MKKSLIALTGAGLVLALAACSNKTETATEPGEYIIKNDAGMEVKVTNYGGRIMQMLVADRDGKKQDVVLGFDSVADYLTKPSNFGAVIGRYGNRIDHGRIVINGDSIQLPTNNYGHCLHGGPTGWDVKLFTVDQLNDSSITLSIVSPDGDNNFPGTVKASVKYTVRHDNALQIDYTATTDRTTIINLTNHTYFNLSGDGNQPITDHILYINADGFTPIDSTFMTDGTILGVVGTPMDFTTPHAIGDSINADYEQLRNGLGYDHNYVLRAVDFDDLAASLHSPTTGITMDVYTTEPGIQVYTGNFLDGNTIGKNGIGYPHRSAICLETQHYPNSPNVPEWPSVILEPGKTYRTTTVYKFKAE